MAARIVNGQVQWGNMAPRLVSSRSRGGGGQTSGQMLAQQRMEREKAAAAAAQAQAGWQANQDAANAQNQSQYEAALASVAGTRGEITGAGGYYDAMQGLMENMGESGMEDIATRETQQLGANTQSNISRGLANTTIQNTTERGIQSDAARSRRDLNERVALSKAGVLGQRAGQAESLGRLEADSIMSRQISGPSNDLYAQLIAQMFSA